MKNAYWDIYVCVGGGGVGERGIISPGRVSPLKSLNVAASFLSWFHTFMMSGLFYFNSLDRSISNRRDVWIKFVF